MSITRTIRDEIVRHRQRALAIGFRGLSQVLLVIPPMIVLRTYGPGGFGLFSMFIAVAGLSVLFEWGMPIKVQNEVSRGDRSHSYDLRWVLGEGRLPLHLGVNLVLASLLWWVSARWMDSVFPGQVAQVIHAHRYTMLGLFLLAGSIGATYHGRSVVFGQGHINKGYGFTLMAATIVVMATLVLVKVGVPIEVLILCAASTPLLDQILSCAYCFLRREPLARHAAMPLPLGAGRAAEAPRRSIALRFFYLQVVSLVASNMDAIYAGRANSLGAVGEYAFLLKLFGVPLLIASIMNTASLPRMAVEAHDPANRGRETVRALLRSNLLLMALAGLVVVAFGGFAYQLISGHPAPLQTLSLLMLIDMMAQVVRGVFTVFLQAAESLGLVILGNGFFALGAIVLKVGMVDRFGVKGLIMANTLAYLGLLLPFQLAAYRRVQRR